MHIDRMLDGIAVGRVFAEQHDICITDHGPVYGRDKLRKAPACKVLASIAQVIRLRRIAVVNALFDASAIERKISPDFMTVL